MSELESLFSAAAPPLSASAAEKLAKKAPPKQEKTHLVGPGFLCNFSFLRSTNDTYERLIHVDYLMSA